MVHVVAAVLVLVGVVAQRPNVSILSTPAIDEQSLAGVCLDLDGVSVGVTLTFQWHDFTRCTDKRVQSYATFNTAPLAHHPSHSHTQPHSRARSLTATHPTL
jgi:hypothetical protein